MKKLDLSEKELKIVKTILKQYLPGKDIYVFGSRVANKARPFSDLDLVIVSDEHIDELLLIELKDKFSDSNLPMRVDIIDGSKITEEFKAEISQNWIKI